MVKRVSKRLRKLENALTPVLKLSYLGCEQPSIVFMNASNIWIVGVLSKIQDEDQKFLVNFSGGAKGRLLRL